VPFHNGYETGSRNHLGPEELSRQNACPENNVSASSNARRLSVRDFGGWWSGPWNIVLRLSEQFEPIPKAHSRLLKQLLLKRVRDGDHGALEVAGFPVTPPRVRA
jgi:hypothetical protein